MTAPEQQDTPPLTRKQMRELRNTGATPVISLDEAAAAAAEPVPLPKPATPAVVPPAPVPDASVDLGAAPLTRRQARQQERIRTASVPVITPDVIAAHTAAPEAPVAEPISSVPGREAPATEDEVVVEDEPAEEIVVDETPVDEVADIEAEPVEEIVVDETPVDDVAIEDETDADAGVETPEESADITDEASVDAEDVTPIDEDEADADAGDVSEETVEEVERAIVNPALGESLIAGEPVEIDLPPSFDQLLARGTTGSISTPNALILSQTTGDLPIVAPVTATGEVLVTGTLNLPAGLGSTGHAPGTADGKDVDAVLIDGELPAHSSPTPIAASAAISTLKTNDDVIRPPAPEKDNRLLIWLGITIGVLALATIGVLAYSISIGAL